MYRGTLALFAAAFFLIRESGAAQASPDAEFSRAMQLAAAGQFAEAENSLRGLETTHPKVFEVRYRLGLVLLRQEKAKEAIQAFQVALSLSPDSALAWAGLAQSRWKHQLRSEAMLAAAHGSKLASRQPAAWRALALFYAEAGEFGKAADCEERWAEATPGDSQSRTRAARYYAAAGKSYRSGKQPGKAADAFQKAISLAPDQPEAYFEFAAMLLDHRTPEPAIPVLQEAAARFPKDTEFRRLLGLAHYQIGSIDQAVSDFIALCDLEPSSDIGYASLETLLTEAGSRLSEIIDRFQALRTSQPANPIGHYLLARALSAKGVAAAELESLLRQSIRTAGDFWPAYYELGVLLEKEGNTVEAVRALTESARLNPSHAPSHFALAQLHARTGDRAKAVEHRKIHNKLLAQQRTLAERAREESPALSYRPNDR
jgi:tetratricopeptide (TPR) repeat protein